MLPGEPMISAETAEVIVYAMLVVIAVQSIWLILLTYHMFKRMHADEQAVREARMDKIEAERKTVIEDIFLLHRSGLLLKHYTRRLRPNVDSDVLSGMLVAVQEFVKDSFRGEKGVLNEIKFGELKIVVMEGRWIMVACVVRGERLMDIQPEIAAALADVESMYADLLMNWDGTMDAAPKVDVIMHKLISGGYRGVVPAPLPRVEEVVAG